VNADRPITLMTILTAVVPGREIALAEHLATEIPVGAESPFNRLPDVHFARWVLLGQLRGDYDGWRRALGWWRRPLRMRYLLFTSAFNGPAEELLEQLRIDLTSTVDGVWSHCVNYPGSAGRAAFHAYLTHNRLPNVQEFRAFEHSVPQIRAAVRLRQRHIAMAQDTQAMTPGQIRDRFIEEFLEGEQ
jgi:hypothetical protein